MLRLIIFIFCIAGFQAEAKDFAVSLKANQSNKAHFIKQSLSFMANKENAKVLKNLELIIVEASDLEAEEMKKDSRVAFVEELKNFKGPDKRFSLPFETFGNKQIADYPWGIMNVDAPLAWEATDAGKGIKVLVLDTGIDQDHPNLSSRLVEARDLINSTDENLPYPHFDGIGHGTHVAGSILADGTNAGVIGVAPSASLYVGKVCNNGCVSSAILEGIEWAIEEKMDVVNLSLGGPFGNATAQRVYQTAEDANVIVIAASGNDGRGSVSYPASYTSVLSVGAIDESETIAPFSNWGSNLDVVAPGVDVLSAVPQGTGREASLSISVGDTAKDLDTYIIDGTPVGEVSDLPIVYTGLGSPADFEGLDLSGKIALVSRGEIAFGDKAKNAIAAGAEAILIFNNVPNETLRATFGTPLEILGLTMTMEEGQTLVEALAQEEAPAVSGNMAIVASDFAFLAGTSMATPHVAGIAALVRAANPDLNASEVKDVIRNSALPTTNDNTQNKYGHGMANALKAVETAQSFLP